MNIGDRVRVYRQIDWVQRDCEYGSQHTVTIYAPKTLTITDIKVELVKWLDYIADAHGEVYYAQDHQGRQYRKEPHWDGPRATSWVREDGLPFTQYPASNAEDHLGNKIESY